MASVFKRKKGDVRGRWQAAWTDACGIRRMKSTGTTIKDYAQQIAAKWEGDARLRRAGVIDADAERLEQHQHDRVKTCLIDFDRELRASGQCEQANLIFSRLESIRVAGNLHCLGDLQPAAVTAALAELKRDRKLSGTTAGQYLSHMQRFTRWLSRRGLLARDPLAELRKPKAERRFYRRMLLPDELVWLRMVLWDGARARYLRYATAIQTGYRASELASLRTGDLAAGPKPSLSCRRTKNGKPAKQYLSHKLAAALRELPRQFFGPSPRFWAAELRVDLAFARARWLAEGGQPESDFLLPVNHAGKRLDFHSLRHSCGAWLILAGANIKVVQAVMRHAKITTTLDTYGHLLPGAEAAAVDLFPAML